jgi:hypothetical protein
VSARNQRLLLAAAVAAALCALLLHCAVAGHLDLFAFAGPLFLLAVPLVAGRYVGEEALDRLRRDRPSRRRSLIARSLPKGTQRAAVMLPRGGRLIAEALAVRPPPRSVPS